MENSVFDILLVEDDPEDAELTLHSLKKYNLANRILHLDGGEKALDFLCTVSINTRPMLMLLDLKMPGVDGIQVLRKIKSDHKNYHIKVIALLSSKEGRHYVESFGLKADGYLIKPVEYKNFSTLVCELGISSTILATLPVHRSGVV